MDVDVWGGLFLDQICDGDWVVQVFGCWFEKLMEHPRRHTIQDVGAILLVGVRIQGDRRLRLVGRAGIVVTCIFRFAWWMIWRWRGGLCFDESQ